MSLVIHPLVFLPFHLATHHIVARTFKHAKPITYSLHLLLTLLQYGAEHFTEELPKLGELTAVLTPIALSVVPYFFYCCYKRTAGPTSHITASLLAFLVMAGVFQNLELGFPKDDPKDQVVANKDASHSHWHFLIHTLIITVYMVATKDVSASEVPAIKEAMATTIPSSPKHTTLSPSRRQVQVKDGCEPSAFQATWPKPSLARPKVA